MSKWPQELRLRVLDLLLEHTRGAATPGGGVRVGVGVAIEKQKQKQKQVGF